MNDILILLAIIGAWLFVQAYVLPKLGIRS